MIRATMSESGQIRKSGGTARGSAPGGEADEIRAKAEVAARRSALEGEADVPVAWPKLRLLATSGLPTRVVIQSERASLRLRARLRKSCRR